MTDDINDPIKSWIRDTTDRQDDAEDRLDKVESHLKIVMIGGTVVTLMVLVQFKILNGLQKALAQLIQMDLAGVPAGTTARTMVVPTDTVPEVLDETKNVPVVPVAEPVEVGAARELSDEEVRRILSDSELSDLYGQDPGVAMG